ncbi:hypothetical protein CBR_g46218 [Chara braunii]|uniref:Reverse transcriptase RNase H-like domain-containing protein n=1 Tax=Chara braunii TaxID=69332 RepID=A0A388K3T2_CHABU|nr:hypothetical protein CBR_g46218 [Chara braunii]|eukprot:GBG64676.1 hypothetical protein CBR_g46218 [Chara braunii]
MVDTRTGTSTSPYTAERDAKPAAILKERREQKEAKKKALIEEQAAKLKKIEEEIAKEKVRLKKEEEEKLKAVEEEEEVEEPPLERRRTGGRGESSGTKEDQMEEKITEWVVGLSLGEEEEADEGEEKENGGGEPGRERVGGKEAKSADGDAGGPTGEDGDHGEKQRANFARELATHVGSKVKACLEGTKHYCTSAIEGAKLTAPKEEEARPQRKPVKVKFPDSYSRKKEENFDNWEANVKTYVHLQTVSPVEHVLIVVHALRVEAANFARSLCRATNCNDDLVAYSAFTPLTDFLKLLPGRFADVSHSVKASDRLQTIHSRQSKSARALKGVTDELVVLPDHGVTETQLVNLFYRAMPEQLRGHFFEKHRQPTMTYDALSREVVAFEAWSMSISTFWHKDLDKGGRTISGQLKTKDRLILTLDEGGVEEVPYEQIEWGLRKRTVTLVGGGPTLLSQLEGGRKEEVKARAKGAGPQGGVPRAIRGLAVEEENCQVGGRGQEDSKIVVIRDSATPLTLTELRSFLHLANYYRKFMRNFSTITAPLRRLLKKETIWRWDKDCTSAMKKLKQALIEYPVLKVADPSSPFVVTTDASQYGIGVVLQQDDGNGYRPVEFMSARMPLEKVVTSTYERELYSLRQALEHWKHYLLGMHFNVYSDHETLRWLKTQAKMTPKLTRWAAELDQYDFELKPVKGKYNVVADALSS